MAVGGVQVVDMEVPPEQEDTRGEKRHLEGENEGFVQVSKRHTFAPKPPEETSLIRVENRYEILRQTKESREANLPPPIIISPPISQTDLRRILRQEGVTQFSVNSSRTETRLYLTTARDHYNATILLRADREVQFHSFAPRGTKRSK